MNFSNEKELLLITGFNTISNLAYKSFPVKNVFFDFVFWVIPQYLVIVYPDHKLSYIEFLVSCCDFKPTKPHLKQYLKEYDIPTWLRSNVFLMVAISIFGVDFDFFPKKFGKTDYYGYKLMDIGVGSYVYIAGVMSVKYNFSKNVKLVCTLMVLGVIRLFCISFFNLDVNIREYGKHLNFYFLLAICNMIYGILKSDYDFIAGYIIISSYDYLLKNSNLAKFILSDNLRSGILEENKEGLASIVCYMSIFFMSNLCGRIFFSKYSWRRKLFNIGLITALFYSAYKSHLKYEEPSRRLGNGTYVYWILFLHTLQLFVYYSMTIITGSLVILTQLNTSKNMLVGFLLSNLQVLIFKKMFILEKVNEFYGNFLMIFYLMISFMFPVFLSRCLFKFIKSRMNKIIK
ncbi:GPI-anchored wall transfer protein 1 [Nosema bombycis CQ1]|uniref:GPI-anchored wall transfer protein n=1 Tax=Nosema bombycis (strain CQ1 / CVCC 102059) TaxID=578461 RepID=R0M7E4_NOSB1|nr:GPI-anchored wall transfer protein 1 [Nosema bombycis CQ1]|eukprot:EOB13899.1 GPI-anchored wall transfer protein 1 [Nosema bombycis CQ1]